MKFQPIDLFQTSSKASLIAIQTLKILKLKTLKNISRWDFGVDRCDPEIDDSSYEINESKEGEYIEFEELQATAREWIEELDKDRKEELTRFVNNFISADRIFDEIKPSCIIYDTELPRIHRAFLDAAKRKNISTLEN